jgi:hypothetical protein
MCVDCRLANISFKISVFISEMDLLLSFISSNAEFIQASKKRIGEGVVDVTQW